MSFEKFEVKDILIIFFSVFLYLVLNVLFKALFTMVNIFLVPIILAFLGLSNANFEIISTVLAQSVFLLTVGASVFIFIYYKIQKLGAIIIFALFYSVFLYVLGMRPLLWFVFIVLTGIVADIILNLSSYKNKELSALAYAIIGPTWMIFSLYGVVSYILPILASFAGVYLMYDNVSKRL